MIAATVHKLLSISRANGCEHWRMVTLVHSSFAARKSMQHSKTPLQKFFSLFVTLLSVIFPCRIERHGKIYYSLPLDVAMNNLTGFRQKREKVDPFPGGGSRRPPYRAVGATPSSTSRPGACPSARCPGPSARPGSDPPRRSSLPCGPPDASRSEPPPRRPSRRPRPRPCK